MANKSKEEPKTAPESDRWYDITLGPSFKDESSNKYCTLRCKLLNKNAFSNLPLCLVVQYMFFVLFVANRQGTFMLDFAITILFRVLTLNYICFPFAFSCLFWVLIFDVLTFV